MPMTATRVMVREISGVPAPEQTSCPGMILYAVNCLPPLRPFAGSRGQARGTGIGALSHTIQADGLAGPLVAQRPSRGVHKQ